MPWVLVDVVIVVAALLVLVVAALRLWQRLRATTRAVGAASTRIGEASAGLDGVQHPGAGVTSRSPR